MKQRYILIEPKYADPDTYCRFTAGSERVRASIEHYIDIEMLLGVADALAASALAKEWPPEYEHGGVDVYPVSGLCLTVMPHEGARRELRLQVLDEYLDDGAPFRADIRFDLSPTEAAEIARELRSWCGRPEYVFVWKGD